jgi:hypothetical protein
MLRPAQLLVGSAAPRYRALLATLQGATGSAAVERCVLELSDVGARCLQASGARGGSGQVGRQRVG